MKSVNGVRYVSPDVEVSLERPSDKNAVPDHPVPASSENRRGDRRLDDSTIEDLSYLQWGLDAVHADAAHAAGIKGDGVVVAVLDAGFQLDHPDLAPNFLPGYSFITGEDVDFTGTPGDLSPATHAAGIIAAIEGNGGITGESGILRVLMRFMVPTFILSPCLSPLCRCCADGKDPADQGLQ
jgi:subtilisin family serine protease